MICLTKELTRIKDQDVGIRLVIDTRFSRSITGAKADLRGAVSIPSPHYGDGNVMSLVRSRWFSDTVSHLLKL